MKMVKGGTKDVSRSIGYRSSVYYSIYIEQLPDEKLRQ
jgi:hypothetical protein